MSLLKKIRRFYNKSEENKMQVFELIGFIGMPVLVLFLLYVGVLLFLK
jgi:hypothetical protein